jgi:formylglycine-generating enzyme required for sulfatase activity
MRPRRLLLILALLVLLVVPVVAWLNGGSPPLRLVLWYGLTPGCWPTGRTLTVEGVEFVEIGPGCFLMGSRKYAKGGDLLGKWCAMIGLPWGDQPKPSNEMPVHWVEFPCGFFIANTEVTNAQYEAFVPDHERGEYSSGDSDPVVDVSWEDAKEYCAWLGQQSGRTVRLPSESEWEGACRAGSRVEFCFGGDEKRLGEYAWYDANSDGKAYEVGTRLANAWGLHDFHGNVSEWCQDTVHRSYEGAPTDGRPWIDNGVKYWRTGQAIREQRGGSYEDRASRCRSASRFTRGAVDSSQHVGFRPAFSALID